MAIVQRQPADKPGPQIVSTILRSVNAQMERGRNELNRSSTDMILKTGQLVDSSFIQPGDIVEIQDKSGSVKGKVTSFSISGSHESSSINIVVECVKK